MKEVCIFSLLPGGIRSPGLHTSSVLCWEGRHCLLLLGGVEVLILQVVFTDIAVQVNLLPLGDSESPDCLPGYLIPSYVVGRNISHSCTGEGLGFPHGL